MASLGSTAGWTAHWASQRGAAHWRDAAPNQDAVGARTLPGWDGIVVALADGHGGARYVRADIGSQLAVDVGCETVCQVLPGLDATGPELEAAVLTSLVPVLVERWAAAVDTHMQQHPVFGEGGRGDPRIAYGTTLLVVACGRDGLLAMQIGDGDLLVVRQDGRVQQPLPRDPRLTGDVTTSICSPDAARDFRVAHVSDVVDVGLVLLASDGYGNSFADRDWRATVGADLLRLLGADGPDRVAAALPGWLSESAEVGGDDVTVALVLPKMARTSP